MHTYIHVYMYIYIYIYVYIHTHTNNNTNNNNKTSTDNTMLYSNVWEAAPSRGGVRATAPHGWLRSRS